MVRILLLSLLLLTWLTTLSQSLVNDSSFIADAKKKSLKLYSQSIGPQSHIYNGNAYIEYHQQNEEHPYFIDEWIQGTIIYENEYYENIPLLYDLSKDKLITDHQYNVNKLQLVSSKIKLFTLQQHSFVNLTKENIPIGFYELLYDGNIKLYEKRRKTLQETISGQVIERRFEEKNFYFLLKDGKMISVKGKKSVLEIFADRKSEIRKFIRANSVNFKADRAKALSQVVKFYDQSQL